MADMDHKRRPRSKASLQLRGALTARFASFARRHSYGYDSSQKLTNRTHQDASHLTERGFGTGSESGMVAIMVTLILMIVISLIVLGFAQVSRRNQREALDHQLSTQAFYAAESGVNDAANLIKSELALGHSIPAKQDCSSGGIYAGLAPTLDSASGVAYTCLTVDPQPTTLAYKNIGTTSTIVPLKAASGTISSVTLTWRTLDTSTTPSAGCRPNMTNPFLTTSAWSASNCGYGVLRVDLVPTAGSALALANLQNQTMTTFLVPLTPTGTGVAANPIAYATGGGNSVLGVRCSNISCTQTINNLNSTQYYVRISSIYKNVSLEIAARDASNVALNLQGAQAVVDATGKAQDVLRRIQVRVPLTVSSTNLLSDYIIESNEAICKRFSVMTNYFNNDADNAVSGVENTTSNPLCKP